MTIDANTTQIEIASILFDDIFGRGHGKEITISRFMAVLGVSESKAYELFDEVSELTIGA